jgi:hypothetical protein
MTHISRKLTRRLLFQKLFVLGFSYLSDDDFFEFFYFDNQKIEVDREYFKEMQNIILEKE